MYNFHKLIHKKICTRTMKKRTKLEINSNPMEFISKECALNDDPCALNGSGHLLES